MYVDDKTRLRVKMGQTIFFGLGIFQSPVTRATRNEKKTGAFWVATSASDVTYVPGCV
jgi:hypothetical protein